MRRTYDVGRMLAFAPGQPILFTAVTPAIVMPLGGEPLGSRFIERNFVSSSKERIAPAKEDWRAGRTSSGKKKPRHEGGA